MIRLMNMTDCRWDEERFQNGQSVAKFLQRHNLDGLELMHLPGGEPSFFQTENVKGLHLRNWYDWVDLWNGNLGNLLREYETLDQIREIYGGLGRDRILKPLQTDLELARRLHVSYVVFHVCDVKNTEFFTNRLLHTDEEVVDAAAELINELLDGKPFEFEFLMENLWWPGLTMTRPEITERLLEQVHYPRKGIMLDTGHLMHTNLELSTEEEAIDYVLEQIEEHGKLTAYIRGIHLNQSLTGSYVKEFLSHKDEMPASHRERDAACYEHVFRIDPHLPFTSHRALELVEAVQPEYLTYEFISSSREELEEKIRQQNRTLIS